VEALCKESDGDGVGERWRVFVVSACEEYDGILKVSVCGSLDSRAGVWLWDVLRVPYRELFVDSLTFAGTRCGLPVVTGPHGVDLVDKNGGLYSVIFFSVIQAVLDTDELRDEDALCSKASGYRGNMVFVGDGAAGPFATGW